jgi:hypothetical protein
MIVSDLFHEVRTVDCYTWFVRHDSHKGTPQANARCVGLVGLLRSLYLERVKLEANVPKVVFSFV